MAVDWLKQVINNNEIKDDAVVTLGGGQTVSVGEIRSLTKAQQKLLTDREATLAAREADLQKNLEILQAAQAETAKLFTDLQNDKNKRGSKGDEPPVNPFEALERDPVIGPLAKAIREQQDMFNKFKTDALAPIVKAQQDMASAYVANRIEDMYDRLVPESKRATLSLESILKVANDNNFKDRYGVPDIRRAYQFVSTKPITQEDLDKQIAEAKEAGRKEAIEASRLRVPRPGIGSVSGRPESSFKPTQLNSVSDALTEAINAAAKDADIWANVDTSTIQ